MGNFATTSAATVAKAYGSNVTAGNLLVATFGWGNSGQTGTVAGSLNGAFTAIASSLATDAGNFRAEVFYLVAGSSGAETITGTSSGNNTQRELVIYELAGASATGIPDSQVGASGSTSNPTTSITIVAQPGWIISYAMATAGTLTAGSGYTSDLAQNGDLAEHLAYSATGSTSVPYVDASVSHWVITAAAFLEATGGGAATVKQLAALGVG